MTFFDGPQLGGPQMDPNAQAQVYAKENGISLDEAKAQLRAKFGDPQKPNSTFAPEPQNIPSGVSGPIFTYRPDGTNYSYNPADFSMQTPQDLEKLVKNEAKRIGMSEQDFALELGLPPREREDKTEMLKSLGIPQEIIDKGDDTIRKYADDHGIDLPAKERK